MAVPDLPPPSGGWPFHPNNGAALQNLDLRGMDVDDLLALRLELDQHLPVKALRDVNLERELVIQLTSTQALQRMVMMEEEVPANQRAQVANAVASVLEKLVRMQDEIHTSERLKKIEFALVEAIKNLPEQAQRDFMAHYEKVLKG